MVHARKIFVELIKLKRQRKASHIHNVLQVIKCLHVHFLTCPHFPCLCRMTALWDREDSCYLVGQLRKLRLGDIEWFMSGDLYLPWISVGQVKLSMSKNERLSSHLIHDHFIHYLGQKPWCHLDYCLSHSTSGQPETVVYWKMLWLQPSLSISLHHSGLSHCHLICLNGLLPDPSTLSLPTSGVRAQI